MVALILLLVLVGVLLWLVPMDNRIKTVIVVLVILFVILRLLGYV